MRSNATASKDAHHLEQRASSVVPPDVMKDAIRPDRIEGGVTKGQVALICDGQTANERRLRLGEAAHGGTDVDADEPEPSLREAKGVKASTAAEVEDESTRRH